jgi:serine/threonine protein kinase
MTTFSPLGLTKWFSPLRTMNNAVSPRSCLGQYTLAQSPQGGKHGEVFIVRHRKPLGAIQPTTPTSARLYAIKRQVIGRKDGKERARRERRINDELNKLGKQNRCFNFAMLFDWVECTTDVEPTNVFATPKPKRKVESVESSTSSTRGRGKRLRSTTTTEKQNEEDGGEKFLHMVLEYGEDTLQSSISRLSLAAYREVLFQVIYALHVAGESFSFCHYDMHERNILLRAKPKGKEYCIIYFQGCAHYITGRMVKIIDFGLSRLTTEEGEVLYNTKDSMRELFSPAADLQCIASWRWRKTAEDLAEDVALFYDLRKQLRKGIATAKLLTHPFFLPLQHPPPVDDPSRAIVVAAEGTEAIPVDLLPYTLYPIPL